MLIYRKTSTLAVHHVLDPEFMGTMAEAAVKDGARVLGHIAEEAAGKLAGEWVKRIAEKVRSHLTDHSEKLSLVLVQANEKAWKTIEIALGGQRFWDKFRSVEDQALANQVKSFLASAVKEDDPAYLTACLKELRQAKAKGHLAADAAFHPEILAEEVGPFARFDDPEALLGAECAVVEEIARELHRLGYRHLGQLLAVTPTGGQPLLAMAVQYYLRRAVAEDPVLSRELTWVKQNAIDRRVENGFAFLTLIQERHGQTLEETLDGLARVEVLVVETRDAVLNLHADVRGLTDQFKLLRRDLTAGHSLSYRDEQERELIEAVKRRYRALTEQQRKNFPQLSLDLSQLEIVAGNYSDALRDAREAAQHLDEPGPKAKAHHAAYRAALELKDWDEALTQLRLAARADSKFAIWPWNKYEIERILGAGAFGVALLCRDTYLDRPVVIKSFEATGLDRDVATLFREARILDSLKNPGIIQLHSCGFVDEVRKNRPYLEIAHFPDSLTLEHYCQTHGSVSTNDLHSVATQIAQALLAAHSEGVLHRDVKPANLLLRKTARGLELKVIDFGLSLRRSLIQTSQARAASQGRSMIGSTIAGTLNYAAPEQLDPNRTHEIGHHSDVFGFGRTCYFALFGEPDPDQQDIDTLSPRWKDFLGRCTAKKIDRRPTNFSAVLALLAAIQEPTIVVIPPPPPEPQSHFTNSIGVSMVRIEPGQFLMGSTRSQIDMLLKQFPDANRDLFDDEQPQHPVKLTRPFYLGAHPVTVGQFRKFVEMTGYKSEAEKDGTGSYGFFGNEWKQDSSIHWRNPGFSQTDEHPVVCVSHNDALALITWLNEREKRQKRAYRLPTEAEWEYAARAGTNGLYGASDDPSHLDAVAWYGRKSGDQTHLVGHKEKNPFGLYDMLGNVWEWCDDWFDKAFYKPDLQVDTRNSAKASYRVIRGGSWNSDPRNCRPAFRLRDEPENRVYNLGFRLAAVQE